MKNLFKIIAAAALVCPAAVSCEKYVPIESEDAAIARIEKQKSAIPKSKQKCEMDKYAVDLGLDVYWSSIDIGAEAIGRIGNYYFWGETEERDILGRYGASDWMYWDKGKNAPNEVYDSFESLTGDLDPVQTLIGHGWRLPTLKEASALKDATQYDHIKYNGQWGGLVWNEKGVIFLPGEQGNGGINSYFWLSDKGELGYTATELYAVCPSGGSGYLGYGNTNAFEICNLRPVKDKK